MGPSPKSPSRAVTPSQTRSAPETPSASPAIPQPPQLVGLDTAAASSSPLALASLNGVKVAILADADAGRVVILDLEGEPRERTWIDVDGIPGHVRVHPDGRIFATVRDRSEVLALELRCSDIADTCEPELTVVQCWPTAPEPVALGFADDSETLLVSCGWGHTLHGFALEPGGKDVRIALAPQPRGFAVQGDDVWVTHAVGSRLSRASLQAAAVIDERELHWRDDVGDPGWRMTNVPRFAVQGAAVALAGDRVLAPMVLAYPGEPAGQPQGYGMSIDGFEPFFPHEPVLVAIDPDGKTRLRLQREVRNADRPRVSSARRRPPRAQPPCLLPRAIAVDTAREQVLIACQDLGQVVAYTTDDTKLSASQRARWDVGAGTDAIAVDTADAVAWAWSPFDRALTRLALGDEVQSSAQRFILPAVDTPIAALGRRLFHKPTAFDGRSCASCHIDGRDDGLTWLSPRGIVQTPVLAGRLPGTEPFGWHGDGTDLREHMRRTFRRMRAPSPDAAALDALVAWVTTMPSYRPQPAPLSPSAERGKSVFESDEAGCDLCHDDATGTDGDTHRILRGRAIDTPSLRGVGDTAPYMHDGRYATLRETLVHTETAMGSTVALHESQIADLITYLRVL